ncbi:hypothetical protein D3C78_20750 [compost metagenome]
MITKPQVELYRIVGIYFHDAIINAKVGRYTADIYIPSAQIIIEYDGVTFHSGALKEETDKLRDRELADSGHMVLRVREYGLSNISQSGVSQCLMAQRGERVTDLSHMIILMIAMNPTTSDKIKQSLIERIGLSTPKDPVIKVRGQDEYLEEFLSWLTDNKIIMINRINVNGKVYFHKSIAKPFFYNLVTHGYDKLEFDRFMTWLAGDTKVLAIRDTLWVGQKSERRCSIDVKAAKRMYDIPIDAWQTTT